MEWNRIDLERRCCYIPSYQSKGGEPIPVPLSRDAIEVLERWQQIHELNAVRWSSAVRSYVFVYRGRAPIQKLTTRVWRRECKAVGLEGVTFHTMRHAWASWQVQAKTPLRILQELGGWATLEMPLRSPRAPAVGTRFGTEAVYRAQIATRPQTVPISRQELPTPSRSWARQGAWCTSLWSRLYLRHPATAQ